MKAGATLALCIALAGGAANAQFYSGNKLLSMLRGDTLDYVNGLGYVLGVADAINGVAYCPPKGVTAGQLVEMVRGYLEATPQIRHFTAESIVTNVLRNAMPCKQSGSNI